MFKPKKSKNYPFENKKQQEPKN